MDESILTSNIDNSLSSREIESNSIVSTTFESHCPISPNLKSHIVKAIVANLKDIIKDNIQNGLNNYFYRDNIFYLEEIPPVSLDDYVQRLVKYTEMNISNLILSVIYIDHFCVKFNYALSYNSIYRLLLISTYLSLKYNEDNYLSPKIYADLAGISLQDLNNLEYQMCVALDFSFFVNSDYYQQYFVYFSKFSFE